MAKAVCEIYLSKEATKKVAAQYPWVFADQVTNPSSLAIASTGDIAHLHSPKGDFLATALIDKGSKLALRVIDPHKITKVDLDFFTSRLNAAKRKRDRSTDSPYYRLINYEGDGLGGLCIERFGAHFIIDATIEFYFFHKDLLASALKILFEAESISMTYAGHRHLLYGNANAELRIKEDGMSFYIDVTSGQKTGWYYDQRENRSIIKSLSDGAKVLDCFCYSGAFGIYALAGHAKHVTFVDSSKPALELAHRNAILNGFDSGLYTLSVGDAVERMTELFEQKALFDLIILDPPPLFGVSYTFFVVNALVSMVAYIATSNFKFLAMAVPIHFIGLYICSKEPLFIELFKVKADKCSRCRNRFYHGANSYDPF